MLESYVTCNLHSAGQSRVYSMCGTGAGLGGAQLSVESAWHPGGLALSAYTCRDLCCCGLCLVEKRWQGNLGGVQGTLT